MVSKVSWYVWIVSGEVGVRGEGKADLRVDWRLLRKVFQETDRQFKRRLS